MTELRYRAYISYSHKDERLAAWLHRALESYRVPRKLVGTKTAAGTVPARIRPVFRDRDELSSSADLSTTVKQALADSENLIVLCSPAAAASRWVGEEIREFANLGRGHRIFCLIVDGEAEADGSVSACFSSALAEIGMREPLAADVRKWADGKRNAKLKLIAGLLGVKLDELRQRDLQRRRRRQALGTVGAIVVLALAVAAVLGQVSKRQEREKAEQLASFIVDLGEHLQSDTDLKTLATISAESYKYLQGLDPDSLSPQTGEKVALALRQMGRVSQGQGRPTQALEALQRSRDLLARLSKKFPQVNSLLFELGNAEFYIGNLQAQQGRFDSALASMERYYDLTSRLVARDPENPDWVMELASSNNNLAAVRIKRGDRLDQDILGHVAEATRLAEKVSKLRPDDEAISDNYATILAWAADTQLRACNLEKVREVRNKAKDLAESASRSDPANKNLKRRYAFALTGVARVQMLTGRYTRAEKNFGRAIAMLEPLAEMDPSNVEYRKYLMERKMWLAMLLGETGQPERAVPMMRELVEEYGTAFDKNDGSSVSQGDYIDFLLAYADAEIQLGDKASARRQLRAIVELQNNVTTPDDQGLYDLERLVKTRYQLWRLNDTEDSRDLPALPAAPPPADGYQSCSDADSLARVYVMEKQPEKAANEVEYLQSKGYAEPEFMRFCRQYKLCAPKP